MYMFLSKAEKIVILLLRIELERHKTLFGGYGGRYDKGEKKIRKMMDKIVKMGGNPNMKLDLKD